MEEHNIPYFRKLWLTNVTDLENHCEVWEKICLNNSVPEEVLGEIRTNIGLAKLLMNQKLKQFKELINDSEFNTGEKEITCLDLQGFWDMVYNEVEKIKKCFSRLEKCKNNEWRFEEEGSKQLPKKKIPVKREVGAFNKKDDSLKFRALAAKQRLAEAKKKMLALREHQKQQNFVEILESTEDCSKSSQNLNSEDKGKFLGITESKNNTSMRKKCNENLKEDTCVVGKKISSVKSSNQFETVITGKSFTPSIQNKENFVPDNDSSNVKNNSKTQIKLKEKIDMPPTKKRGKDYGKLQCVTRSAKKTLLLQQNMMQK